MTDIKGHLIIFFKEQQSKHCRMEKINCTLSIKLCVRLAASVLDIWWRWERGRDFTANYLRDLFSNQMLRSSYLMKAMGNALFFNLHNMNRTQVCAIIPAMNLFIFTI